MPAAAHGKFLPTSFFPPRHTAQGTYRSLQGMWRMNGERGNKKSLKSKTASPKVRGETEEAYSHHAYFHKSDPDLGSQKSTGD